MDGQVTPPRRRRIIDDATFGLGATRPARVRISGGHFFLVRGDGAQFAVPTVYFDMIVVDANRESSRVFYDKTTPFDPNEKNAPICFSDNGTGPSINAQNPQWPICETCPQNRRGSAYTLNDLPTTACDKRKNLAVIIPGDTEINLYQFQIPPGSLKGFSAYTSWIRTQSHPTTGAEMDIADFVTRVIFDPNKPNTMLFSAVGWVEDTPAELERLAHIENNQLGDTFVGRNDKACEPEAVARMLENKGGPALPPRAEPAPAQPSGYSLPVRQPVAAPPAQPSPVPPQAAPGYVPRGAALATPTAQGAEEGSTPPAPRRPGRPRKKKEGAVDPVQAGFQSAPAPQPTPGQVPRPQFQPPGNATKFQPPGFVQQAAGAPQRGAALATPTAQPTANGGGPKFGMGQPAAPGTNLEHAMNMLPPKG